MTAAHIRAAGMLMAAACLSLSAAHAAAPPSGQASNIAPDDTRSTIAPKLPLPPDGDKLPRQLLLDARAALSHGQSGAAQEALERAETRLLDRGDPGARHGEQHTRLLQAATEARQALGQRKTAHAIAILDAALGGHRALAEAAPRLGNMPPPAPAELAYPPSSGGWRWNGAQWVWAGGPYADAVPAAWVAPHWAWRGGWVLIPGHWQ